MQLAPLVPQGPKVIQATKDYQVMTGLLDLQVPQDLKAIQVLQVLQDLKAILGHKDHKAYKEIRAILGHRAFQ